MFTPFIIVMFATGGLVRQGEIPLLLSVQFFLASWLNRKRWEVLHGIKVVKERLFGMGNLGRGYLVYLGP